MIKHKNGPSNEVKDSSIFPTFGFLISIILTLIAYTIATTETLTHMEMVVTVTICAMLQLAVQLYFFIHLGEDGAKRQNIALGIFAAVILFIICGGSLWVLGHLRDNMMPLRGEMNRMYEGDRIAPEADIRP